MEIITIKDFQKTQNEYLMPATLTNVCAAVQLDVQCSLNGSIVYIIFHHSSNGHCAGHANAPVLPRRIQALANVHPKKQI